MKKYGISLLNILIFTIFFTSSVYAEFRRQVYVAMTLLYFVGPVTSAIVGGFLLRLFIRDLTYPWAFFVSYVGSLFSIAGWLTGSVLVVGLGPGPIELIKDASGLFKLYLMSSFIEMIAIKIFFSYKIKQLLVPVLIVNLITNCIIIAAAILQWL